MPLLLPPSAANSAYVEVPSDIFDIERRIQQGDESGWRGDPTMRIVFNTITTRFEVIGFDNVGREYVAASHDKCDHTLLTKLVMGDPRKNDVVGRVLAQNAKVKADADAKFSEGVRELADKAAWAIRQDVGHLHGGRRTQHSFYDGSKD